MTPTSRGRPHPGPESLGWRAKKIHRGNSEDTRRVPLKMRRGIGSPDQAGAPAWRARQAWGMIEAVILGERVRLRRIERGDLPRFVEWLNDPEVREHLSLGYPLSLSHEEEWFEGTLRQEPAAQPFAIDARGSPPGAEPAERLHIGTVGFHAVDWRNRSAELGIALGRRDSWAKGYAADAARTLCRCGV